MFKIASTEQEIYQSMEKQLVSNNIENKYNFKKLAKAVDYLNAAAEVFEQAGLKSEANDVTELLNKLITVYKKI